MSPGDRLERILKDMHVILAKSPTVTGKPDQVIINRQEFIILLDRLSASVYEMMEVYEQTRQSRQAAERAAQRRGEEILSNASADAEDIYAASYVYTEDTIGRIRSLMDQTNDEMDDLFRKFKRELREQRDMLKVHESQLQAQLADLSDTKKYLNVIREINRQQERLDRERKAAQAAGISHVSRDVLSRADSGGQEYDAQVGIVREAFSAVAADAKSKKRAAAGAAAASGVDSAGGPADDRVGSTVAVGSENGSLGDVPSAAAVRDDYADVSGAEGTSTRIYVNPEYFEKTGTPLPGTKTGASEVPAEKPEIRVNTDAAYFKWKEQQEAEKRKAQGQASEGGQDRAVQSAAEVPETAHPTTAGDGKPDQGTQVAAAGQGEKKAGSGVRGKRSVQELKSEGRQESVAKPEEKKADSGVCGNRSVQEPTKSEGGQESVVEPEEKKAGSGVRGNRSVQEQRSEDGQESVTERQKRETAAARPVRKAAGGAGTSGESRQEESTERLSYRAYYEQTEEEELRYLEAQLMAEFMHSEDWPGDSKDRIAGEEAYNSEFPDEESIRQAVIADENEWEAERIGESGSSRTKSDAKRMFRRIIFGDD